MEEPALKVVLVDDHRVFREALRELLEEHGFVVAEADGPAQAVVLASQIKPDVVLMDLYMPEGSGVEAMGRVHRVSPDTSVLMLSVSSNPSDVEAAIAAGARGYLLKDESVDQILWGVKAAARGETPLSPRIANHLMPETRGRGPATDLPSLTDRERQVLRLLVEGKDNGQIACELTISEHTVKSHVSTLLGKLGVENRVQAAVFAVRNELD